MWGYQLTDLPGAVRWTIPGGTHADAIRAAASIRSLGFVAIVTFRPRICR